MNQAMRDHLHVLHKEGRWEEITNNSEIRKASSNDEIILRRLAAAYAELGYEKQAIEVIECSGYDYKTSKWLLKDLAVYSERLNNLDGKFYFLNLIRQLNKVKVSFYQKHGVGEEIIDFFSANGYLPCEDDISELGSLSSQTTLGERVALMLTSAFYPIGDGLILDIGAAAGGSTYSLAKGLAASDRKENYVYGIDRFEGSYNKTVFPHAFDDCEDDLECFMKQTKRHSDKIVATQLNIESDLAFFCPGIPIRIAHIDAAKNLDSWATVLRRLLSPVPPSGAIWIFQDFDRFHCCYQAICLGSLVRQGARVVGCVSRGTLYIHIPPGFLASNITDALRPTVKLANAISNIYALWSELTRLDQVGFVDIDLALDLDVLMMGYLCFTYLSYGNVQKAMKIWHTIPIQFRRHSLARNICEYFGRETGFNPYKS